MRTSEAPMGRNRSHTQRKSSTNRDENAAAGLVETSSDAGEPGPDSVRTARQRELGDDLGRREGGGHHGELLQQAALRVDELRQKGAEEEQALGIGGRREQALTEQTPAFRLDPFAHDHRNGRQAPDLDTKPDEVKAAEPFQ